MILITEQKIKIGKYLLNFVTSKLKDVKVDRTLFLIPGGLESASSAFQPQLENLPKLLPNFQIISYDPPGIGKSRPPSKREFKVDGKFVANGQLKDTENIIRGLDQLKVDKFCLLGWSYGGSVASIIASKLSNRVDKLILLTTMAYIDDNLINRLELTRDISLWPEEMRKPFVELYGFEEFKETWSELVDYFEELRKNNSMEKQIEVVRGIKAPTLIFHGEKDFYIEDAASKFLHDNIKSSRMIIYKGSKGPHNLHLKHHEEFNQQLADFLNETSKL